MQSSVNYRNMEHRISATELARRLGDVLARVRYRSDSFVVDRNGEPVARIVPLPEGSVTTLHEALRRVEGRRASPFWLRG